MKHNAMALRVEDVRESVHAMLQSMGAATVEQQLAALEPRLKASKSIVDKHGIVVVAEDGVAITCYHYDSYRRARQHRHH